MTPIEAIEIPWATLGTSPDRMRVYINNLLKTNRAIRLAATVICNTSEEIESKALDLVLNALPVSPLEAPPVSNSSAAGHFWPEDATCLAWLDARTRGSVIYVAFGSLTVFDVACFEELADGLELTGRPFLWAVRPNITDGVVEGAVSRGRG
jgi:hypothetical protein